MNPMIATAIISSGKELISKWFGDKEEAKQKIIELELMVMKGEMQSLQTVADIIKTEAKSEHFLTSCWRPIVMLIFTSLVVAKWLGYTAPGVTEQMEARLMDIVELGIGGYVIGRSAEKVVKEYKKSSV